MRQSVRESVRESVGQRWITRSLLSTPFLLAPFFCTPIILAAIFGQSERAIAQSSTCAPPRSDEYLLLVRNPNADTQNQLRQLLPTSAVLTDCLYDNNPVVRVEGFVSAEIANAWAQYLSNSAGLLAIVARPPVAANSPTPPATPATASTAAPATEANATAANFPSPTITPSQPTSANPPSPTPQPSAPATNPPANPPAANSPAPAPPTTAAAQTSFNPQPLGTGYAVVVSYFNRPEVAIDVQQITSRDVGLVAFEQRPYLLAAYTPDPASASAVLRSLTERGLTASIVDSRRAILLTPSVTR